MTKTQTIVVGSDIHYPYHDPKVFQLFVGFVKWVKPEMVILNGDVADMYAVSSFNKNPQKPAMISEELKSIYPDIFLPLTKASPGAMRLLILGNHEDRLRRYMWKVAPALAGSVTIGSIYGCEGMGWKVLPSGASVELGKLQVMHGEFLSKHSAMTAKNHLDRYGTSVLVGHSHRLGSFYKTDMRGTHGAWEGGCLCDLKPEYVNFPNWQQGWAVVTVWPSGLFNVQLVPVIDRTHVIFGGKEWDSR